MNRKGAEFRPLFLFDMLALNYRNNFVLLFNMNISLRKGAETQKFEQNTLLTGKQFVRNPWDYNNFYSTIASLRSYTLRSRECFTKLRHCQMFFE